MSHLSRLFPAVAFLGAAALAALGTVGYSMHWFGGDGFSYYSALRNLVDGRGLLWEGPELEYLLGNHSYLTLFLLAPVVAIVRHQLVMLYASVTCWLISSLLVYRIAVVIRERLAPGSSPWLPFLLGSIYATSPISLQLALPTNVFQADFMLAPGLLALFLGLVQRRLMLVVGAIAFIAATKEEYIVLMPALAAWGLCGYWAAFGRPWPQRRDWAIAIATYVGTAALCAWLMFHYRAINEINVAVRQLEPESLLKPGILKDTVGYLWVILFPLLPASLLVVWKGDRPTRVFLAFAFLTFVIGREILNWMIYTAAVISFHHTRIILAPTLIIALAIGLLKLARGPRESRHVLGVLVIQVVLNVVGIRVAAIEPALLANDLLRHPETARAVASQIEQIRPFIPPPASSADAIGASDGLAHAFARERDYVIPWVFFKYYPQLKDRIQYTVFAKVHLHPTYVRRFPDYQRFVQEYEVILETKDFVVSRRKGPASSRN